MSGNAAMAERKLRLLERAEARIAKQRDKDRKLSPVEEADKRLKDVVRQVTQERHVATVLETLLFVADVAEEHALPEDTLRMIPSILSDHMSHPVIVADALLLVGKASKRSLADPSTEGLWNVFVLSSIACTRLHKHEATLVSNGLYAIGQLAETSHRIKSQIVEAQGLETINGSLRLHPHDTFLLSNGLLALSAICNLPLQSLQLGKGIAKQIIADVQSIQHTAESLNIMTTLTELEPLLAHDPVLARSYCEAIGALTVSNTALSHDKCVRLASKINAVMSTKFHSIQEEEEAEAAGDQEDLSNQILSWNLESLKRSRVSPYDNWVVAHGALALGRMVLVPSTHRAAGTSKRFPYVTSDAQKQSAVHEAGAMAFLCFALKEFEHDKDVVLTSVLESLKHLLSLHQDNQKEFVSHQGLQRLTRCLELWSEDHAFQLQGARALKVGHVGWRLGLTVSRRCWRERMASGTDGC
uniref:Uncharacterized protein n=1 Tax=Guillardia theta TaxID=55529 RepID=A0A6U6B950_GUITH|mmetsp:Transcript_36747/g.114751  ORF Transcript_36747/g.114751 Transcript_36747/m.114751 type:complete len:471 (+) Transcript_36747:71-1483(+)